MKDDARPRPPSFAVSAEEFEARRAQVHAMGGEAKLAARREAGILNARERIDLLCDPGTFLEIGEFAWSAREEDRHRTAAEGIVTGFGQVEGREVAVASFDLTVLGASSSVTNIRKLDFLKKRASAAGIPCAFLIESAGARMPDIQGAVGMGRIGQLSSMSRERDTPWVSAVLGPCYGMGTWYAVMSDFAVMRKDATFSVSSPKVTSVAMSQEVTPQELGGSDLHAETTGQVDLVTDTDEEAIAALRRFLSYLPSNAAEAPPRAESRPGGAPEAVEALIPPQRQKIYDGRKLVELLADDGSVMSFRPRFGRTLETALARIDGQVVGLVASNPMRKGGAIDGPSCRKMTEFTVLCDSFNIPLILLADTPGFLVGLEAERAGVAGEIMNNIRAVTLATVPKLAVVVRKSYGQAYLNMGGGIADALAVMTTGEVGFVDPAVAVSVVHNRRPGDGEDYGALMQDMVVSNSPWELAGMFAAHAVIRPGETRAWLSRMLAIMRRRPTGEIGAHRLSTWPTSL
ncbi:carboxyl transferase domain-containing protein [Albimonas sp. CAU 1670]|uniref:acyl-CoA carboxylase subunit beta n=1 Tax=Albimonas sp. CAU 1670 TaxID=3032599 RepID=UPI0023DC1F5D|nr:carboxyl transferase domain-containing protein [Albimonas sp. CAU 1670]MDF2231723.1 carboxyl transferase domain-containing protein [Albimonas sp. CAU 1670]